MVSEAMELEDGPKAEKRVAAGTLEAWKMVVQSTIQNILFCHRNNFSFVKIVRDVARIKQRIIDDNKTYVPKPFELHYRQNQVTNITMKL